MNTDGISISAAPDLLKQKAFWTRLLYGAAGATDLCVNASPARYAAAERPKAGTGAYAAQNQPASVVPLDGLEIDGAEAYACCAASLLILVHRYTMATDVMVGTPPQGWRGETPLDSCLLPLRYRFTPETTVGQTRRDVRSLLTEMYRNQDARRAPLLSQISSRPGADNWPRPGVVIATVSDDESTPEPLDGGLVVSVSVAANRLNLAGKFDAGRHDPAGVARLLDDVARIVVSLVKDPNEPASSVAAAIPDADVSRIDQPPAPPDGGAGRNALCEEVGDDGLPRNPVDETLTSLWSEMLKAPHVRINDDFFELGGHSVLAMRLTARIRRIFQTEISLRSVFESPSIAQLSDMITQTEREPGHAARLASVWLRTRALSPAEIQELLQKARGPRHT